MIQSDEACENSIKCLREIKRSIIIQKKELKNLGLTDKQIKFAIEPAISFCKGIEEEIKFYKK